MTDWTREQTHKEHSELLEHISALDRAVPELRAAVQWGRSIWMPDREFLDFLALQRLSLQAVVPLVSGGFYREAFSNTRVVLEGYLLMRLVWAGLRYRRKFRLPPTLSVEERDSLIGRLQQIHGSDLIRIETDKKHITLVLKGVPVVDEQKRRTGNLVPRYYAAWKTYRPDQHHLEKGWLNAKTFLQREWPPMPARYKRQQTEQQQAHSRIYRDYFTFDSLLASLILNGILTKKTATRVVVHYNFLSGFSHTTFESFDRLLRAGTYQQIGDDPVYNHYLSELGLLYVCHLLSMHISFAHDYFRWRRIPLSRIEEHNSLLEETDDRFGYFWFIFNRPHAYDKFEHANAKCDLQKRVVYRPEQIRDAEVRYYKDPLHRLKNLHWTTRELMTGNVFLSPFPRDDAYR